MTGPVVWRLGRDIKIGDGIVGIGSTPHVVIGFEPLDSPLEPITGPGRVAHTSGGVAFAVHDNHGMRVRTATP